MQRITVHITDDTKQRIDLASTARDQVEAELIREALNTGLDLLDPKNSSTQALLDLAKLSKKLTSLPKEPTDVSTDTAKYAFGEKQ